MTKKVVLVLGAVVAMVWMVRPHPVLSHERVATTVTFDREISRIIQRKCLACHTENNLGFPLTTYEETRPWARAIEEEVLRRHMPPWRAVPGYGDFVNSAGLTHRETQFIVAWVEGNGPKTSLETTIINLDLGETAEEDRLQADFDHWHLGPPDLIEPIASGALTPGQGDGVRKVVVGLGLDSDRWIRAVEFMPTDRRAVRAAFFSLEETGQWLGSWTPWYGVTTLPLDVTYEVPAGSRVVAEIHYRSGFEPADDGGSLGLYFAPRAADYSPGDVLVPTAEQETSEERPRRFTGSVRLSGDVNILALKPDMQPGVESIEVSARTPDGRVRVLLLVRNALPEWPTPYILREPVQLGRGTELRVSYFISRSAPLATGPTLTASLYGKAAPVTTPQF